MSTANLNWSASVGATSYKVEYKLHSDSSWTLYNSAISATSVAITGLQEGQAYDFRITSNCATGSSAGTTTTGNTPCLDVTSFTAGFTGTTANLSWAKKTAAVSYTISYKLQSASSYTVAAGSPLNNTGLPDPVLFNIPGLLSGSAYDFQVLVNCVQGTSPGVVISATSACPATSSVTATFS